MEEATQTQRSIMALLQMGALVRAVQTLGANNLE